MLQYLFDILFSTGINQDLFDINDTNLFHIADINQENININYEIILNNINTQYDISTYNVNKQNIKSGAILYSSKKSQYIYKIRDCKTVDELANRLNKRFKNYRRD